MVVQAPAHALSYTEATIERAFGASSEELFDDFPAAPVASGSIGQVYIPAFVCVWLNMWSLRRVKEEVYAALAGCRLVLGCSCAQHLKVPG